MAARKLTLAEIADLRAYERERDDFRRRIIALKKRRRVSVGPFVTFVFENRDTVRFQIQEMARAETLMSDDAIENELRVYNPLIPEPGELCATLFIELTSKAELRQWLPRLVGIETAVGLRLGSGPAARTVRCAVEGGDQRQLTREGPTSSVHYVHFRLGDGDIAAFATEPVALLLDHPEYRHEARLSSETKSELLSDLEPAARPAL